MSYYAGSVRLRVLNAVLEADGRITSQDVAERALTSRRNAARYLVMLWREGLIDRDSGVVRGKTIYYFPRVDVWENVEPEEELVQLPGDKAVDAAIRRMRPHWRKGELFARSSDSLNAWDVT